MITRTITNNFTSVEKALKMKILLDELKEIDVKIENSEELTSSSKYHLVMGTTLFES